MNTVRVMTSKLMGSTPPAAASERQRSAKPMSCDGNEQKLRTVPPLTEAAIAVEMVDGEASDAVVAAQRSGGSQGDGVGKFDSVRLAVFDDGDPHRLRLESRRFLLRGDHGVGCLAVHHLETAIAAFRKAEVILSLNFLLVTVHKNDIWLEPTVAAPDRRQVGVLPIEFCSNHHSHRVHDCFSFRIVLSGKKKQPGFFARNGNRGGNNSRLCYGFLSFVGKFAAF